jgi:hypothetical protein
MKSESDGEIKLSSPNGQNVVSMIARDDCCELTIGCRGGGRFVFRVDPIEKCSIFSVQCGADNEPPAVEIRANDGFVSLVANSQKNEGIGKIIFQRSGAEAGKLKIVRVDGSEYSA